MPNIDECAAPVLPTVCRVCPLASTVCAYTWAAVYRRGHSALSCANASRIREGFSRAHALDMSLIIPGTRWPAGSPSHIGARAPPALRGRALFKRWFNKRVLHVPRLQVWDFARPRAQYSTSASTVCRHAPPFCWCHRDIPAFTPRHQKNTHKCSWKHLATFSFQRESDNGKVLFL